MTSLSDAMRAAAAVLTLSVLSAEGALAAVSIEWVDPSPTQPSASPQASQSHPSPKASAPKSTAHSAPEAPVTSRRPPPPSKPESLANLPPPETSSRSAPSALDVEASNFINAYWANVSGNSDEVLQYLRSIYAADVRYYGKPASRDAVIKDKDAYMRRWPIRHTWPAAGAQIPEISCDATVAECRISGLRDFDAASAERAARSVGVVRYSYRVRFAGGTPKIIAEDSTVVAGK